MPVVLNATDPADCLGLSAPVMPVPLCTPPPWTGAAQGFLRRPWCPRRRKGCSGNAFMPQVVAPHHP
jgi:hypothetical protein